MKKLISVILSVILCFSAFGVVADAEQEITVPFTYTVDEEGLATLVKCDESVEGDVVIPAVIEIDGEFYEVKYIGDNAFENCSFITTITLSEGIEQIGDFAFLNCTALTDLYIPKTLLVCMYTAFNGCNAITVHCYSENYQFFTVFGIIQDMRIDIIDSADDDMELDFGIGGSLGTIDMTNTIILAVKRIIQLILYYFLNYGTEELPGESTEPEVNAPVINTPAGIL